MWELVSSAADWTKFQDAQSAKAAPHGGAVVWGLPPQEYPCLVAPLIQPGKVVCAFCYAADARRLLPARPAPAPAAAPQGVSAAQNSFNRWLAAMSQAFAYFMVETGICTEDRFEEQLLVAIENVDAWRNKTPGVVFDRPTQTILEALDPPT